MTIFVVNCGSSSIKFKLFDMSDERLIASGMLDRVGGDGGELSLSAGGRKHVRDAAAIDHSSGMKIILDILAHPEFGVISSIDEIAGVGHRVVHGGEKLVKSVRIDAAVLEIIRENVELAPLHNPPNIAGIEAAMKAMPDIPHVAVFDTAFQSTLSPVAYRYAVPDEWRKTYGIRKYGFHGTSHRYVTLRAAEILDIPVEKVNLITCHLGNGCSMTAVRGGMAVDHSMGMTPLAGLIMGTRCGDMDPAVVLHLLDKGMAGEEIDRALNRSSGLLGVSGLSNDMRDLLAEISGGGERAEEAKLAVDMFVYQIVKYIGAYMAVLDRVDAIVLTGGIGENSPDIRAMICDRLRHLGIELDAERNAGTVGGEAGAITIDNARMKCWVIPTNEELMIARDTAEYR